jgi:cell division protein FtsW
MFGVQALVNLSVALAILPTKGLTLPFVSFGGSSLLMNAAAAGILLSISRHTYEAEAPQVESPGAASRATAMDSDGGGDLAYADTMAADLAAPGGAAP